ncbi:MAG: hypothetical protein C0483_17950 [Pirellula sp.]|nr:hypothetical protein [Pirellula sp.]
MKRLLSIALVCLLTRTASAETTQIDLGSEFEPFTYASAKAPTLDLVECCAKCRANAAASGTTKPWAFSLTQTSDYGTSLALPIGLTPANTLLAPAGNAAQAGILNNAQAATLGLLGNLGLAPVPPGTDAVGVFEDDFQFQTTGALSYQRQVGEFGTLTASYTYYQNLHPDVKQLDLMSHTPSVQYALKLTDRLTNATYYNYAYYFLSGSSFVTQNRIGNITTFRVNDRWDLAGGTNYANANFRNANYLNSDNYAGTLEATRYMDEARNNYVKVGYGAGYSDAALTGFAYMVNNGFITTRILYGDENRNELRLTGSYGRYDFKGLDPIQQTIYRADNIYNAGLFYGRKIADNVQLFAQYNYLKSNSNVARQLYNSDLISLGILYTR